MKKLVAVVFVLIALVVMVLFSRAQDREQQLVNDRYKAAVMSELLMRAPRELFPRMSMIRWKGSVFLSTPVSAIRAITVRMEGLTAVA